VVQRWWTAAITAAAAGLMIADVYRARPGPGLQGRSLGVTLALAGVVAGLLAAARLIGGTSGPWARPPSQRYLPVPILLLVCAAALVVLQPTGQGVIGLVMGVAVTARLIPGRASALLLTACLTFLLASAVARAGRTGAPGVIDALAVAAFYSLVLSGHRFRQQEQRAEELLIELEETRGAELRAAALAERQRLAREMHDVLAHSLSGLVVQLEGARLLAQSDPADVRLAGTVDRAHQLARSGLDEARRAIGMLRDEELPDPARLAESFTADTGVPCQFAVTGPPRGLSSPVRLALYRVTQEALTNARKHAHPDRVDVRLDYQPDEVRLSVEDFAAAPAVQRPLADTPGGGYGLTGMRERAKLLGGSLTAAPTRTGFLVVLEVPA
jgi:signal transduction histidine kinase